MTVPTGSAPLPLSELRHWVLPRTYEWMEKAEEDEKAWHAENEDAIAGNGANLFEIHDQDETNEEGDKEDPYKYRIRVWYTSRHGRNPDGYSQEKWELHGNEDADNEDKDAINVGTASHNDMEDRGIRAVYMLSESWQGYGDILWSSARHISNLLGNASSCRTLLTPSLLQQAEHSQRNGHPLVGLRFAELGAGAGLPSMVALRCGARVVCTDQAVPDRIRSIAECIERNVREMKSSRTMEEDKAILAMANRARACSLDWGMPIDDVLECLDADKKEERFDFVVAADCCYMPWMQPKLLQSMHQLLSNHGVALIPFALHGNAEDQEVWGIVDRAVNQGFSVDVLEPQQLTPPAATMDHRQGLVHTLRLTKKIGSVSS